MTALWKQILSKELLDRYKNNGTQIYRTDLSGTITITTDGNSIKINTEK